MKLTPYQREQIVLAQPLKWGAEAALAVMPRLTPDKFVYGAREMLGGTDHRNIWAAMEQVVLYHKGQPYIGNLIEYVGTELQAYLESLIGLLTNRYHVHTFDFRTYRRHANRVHHNGKMYRTAAVCAEVGKLVDPDVFVKAAGKMEDADSWSGEVVNAIRTASSSSNEGYVTAAEVMQTEQARLDQILAGQQVMLLPVGVQSLYQHGLPPAGGFVVVHGLSTGGKSTLVENVFCLGTALGIVQHGLSGSVAIHSLEMSKESTMRRMAAALAGFNTQKLAEGKEAVQAIPKEDIERFRYYMDFVGKLPIVIDDDKRLSAAQLTYRATALHMSAQGPIRMLATDYLELFKMKRGSQEREESALAEIAGEHFILAEELGINVTAVSQSQYGQNNKTWVAGLYGMRGSRAITHKAFAVIEVVNYMALARSGTDFRCAKGLDESHAWALLQKYKDGETNAAIPFGWRPEYTQLFDRNMRRDPNNFAISDDDVLLFDHLEEVERLLHKHPTTRVIPIEDTPLADIKQLANGNWLDEEDFEDEEGFS